MRCRITYEDGELLIIHKPAGLATQSANVGQADAVSELKGYLSKKGEKGSFLGVVHRLDQPVEGLLAFAKTQKTAAALTRQLQEGALNKTYHAVVLGKPGEETGELFDLLRKDGNVAKVVTDQKERFPDAKEAKLSYRLLGSTAVKREEDGEGEVISLLEVRIETGRFHQIRAQLSHAGMPILGDQKYGNAASEGVARMLGGKYVALCAKSLEIQHPVTKKNMKWEISPENVIFSRFSMETEK